MLFVWRARKFAGAVDRLETILLRPFTFGLLILMIAFAIDRAWSSLVLAIICKILIGWQGASLHPERDFTELSNPMSFTEIGPHKPLQNKFEPSAYRAKRI